MNSLSSSIQSMAQAFSDMNLSALMDYGNLIARIDKYNNESSELDEIKTSFSNTLELFEHDN